MTKKESTTETINKEPQQEEEAIVIRSDEISDEIQAELDLAKKNAEEYKDMLQRLQAEFDNFRKRNSSAVSEARQNGIEDIMCELLPIIDNFERGLNAIDESVKPGVELIYKSVLALIHKYDVEEIKAMGEEFNPLYHHAIATVDDKENENHIVEVYQKGYIRKNKVLRPAMVKVAQ